MEETNRDQILCKGGIDGQSGISQRNSISLAHEVQALIYGHGRIAGIVSVAANRKGIATLFVRRAGRTVRLTESFTPWILVSEKRLLRNLRGGHVKDLQGDLDYKWMVEIEDYELVTRSIISNYNQWKNENAKSLRDIDGVYELGVVEQYLVQSGNTYYKNLRNCDLVRLWLDIETTGLDAETCQVFMIGVMCGGEKYILQKMPEKELLVELNKLIQKLDPDIIEGHNIFGFDLLFLEKRYAVNHISVQWGRDGRGFFSYQDSIKVGENPEGFNRYTLRGREIVDIIHSVKRFDAVKRTLPNHKLKDVAKALGVARDEHDYIDGDKIYETYLTDPEKVVSYLKADLEETAALSKLLNGDRFTLAQMMPMRFEKVCTSGSANFVELPLVRAYILAGHSMPTPMKKESFEGARTALHRDGRFEDAIKVDVRSMYPNIILMKGVGPSADPLNRFLPFLAELTKLRVALKALGEFDREADIAQSALKIVINSFYGYLGYERGLFNNFLSAALVTKIGQEVSMVIENSINRHGGTLIETDTDGVICLFPKEKYSVQEFINLVNQDLTDYPGVQVESESREPWTALYVHRVKNYAILDAKGKLKLVGVAMKSRAIPPFFRTFTKEALRLVLINDVVGLRALYLKAHREVSGGTVSPSDFCTKVKLGNSLENYIAKKKTRVVHFEVLLEAGYTNAPERTEVFYYKSTTGYRHISLFKNDYDVDYYLKALRKRMELVRKAFSPADYAALISDDETASVPAEMLNSEVESQPKVGWTNLGKNIKREEGVARNKFVSIDDEEAMADFIDKNDGVDLYRSHFACYSATKPKAAKTADLQKYPLLGDLTIEGEGQALGKSDDELVTGHAARVILELKRIFEEDFKIPRSHMRLYFNGNKSIYLRVSHRCFTLDPTHRLEARYEALVRKMSEALPAEIAKTIDFSLYESNRLLRIPGTQYPDAGFMNVVDEAPLRGEKVLETLRSLVLPPMDDLDPFFMDVENLPELEYSRTKFLEYTAQARFKEYRGKKSGQKEKNALIESVLRKGGETQAPCIKNITNAIVREESIFFGGRCKLIYECTRAGISENEICKIFLQNDEPGRYKILERDDRPRPNECGYRLQENFRKSLSIDFPCASPELSGFCQVERCYRKDIDHKIKMLEGGLSGPSFIEFQEKARLTLEEFFK